MRRKLLIKKVKKTKKGAMLTKIKWVVRQRNLRFALRCYFMERIPKNKKKINANTCLFCSTSGQRSVVFFFLCLWHNPSVERSTIDNRVCKAF